MRNTPRRERRRLERVYRAPALLAVSTVLGLSSALLGDGGWDALSWAALGVPLLAAALAARRRAAV